ncbi:MAG: TrkA C-terminal domain-containing protein [Elainellaceae cyanobacterium]
MNSTNPKILAARLQHIDPLCGLHLQEISLPQHCHFLGILRQGNIILANRNPVLHEGDLIIAIAVHSMIVPELLTCLKGHLFVGNWLETTSVHWSNRS